MKKLFVTITLLLVLVCSAFAYNFKEYGKFKNKKAGEYTVLIDLEATEPFDIEKESIKHLLFLQQQEEYSYVYVIWYEPSGDELYLKNISFTVHLKCMRTMILKNVYVAMEV